MLILLIFPVPEVRETLFLRLLRCRCLLPRQKREAPKPEICASALEHIEAPLPLLRPRPTCERLELPFSDDDILSGYEDHHLPRSDQFTMWGKMTSEEFLAEHVVDIHRMVPDFVDAFERMQTSSCQLLQLESWAPAWKGRRILRNKLRRSGIITLQEASDSNTIFFKNDFTWPTLRVVQFSSTRILSTLTSA